jgi:hypothetical protein
MLFKPLDNSDVPLSDVSQNTWILRKFADSSNGSEKVENAVWLAEHIGTFPTDVFLSIISKLA